MPDVNVAEPRNMIEVQQALLDFVEARTRPSPAIKAAVRQAATRSLPPDITNLVQLLWDAGPRVSKPAKVLGARLAAWTAARMQMDIGNDGRADQYRRAWSRELGIAGNWPDPADDPARGEVKA